LRDFGDEEEVLFHLHGLLICWGQKNSWGKDDGKLFFRFKECIFAMSG
jgi:hypothetical protein